MSQNTSPVFARTPIFAQAYLTSAYTDRTGVAGGLVTLTTAGSAGSKVTQVGVKFTGNAISGSLLVFITNTAGATPRLFDEVPVLTSVVSTTSGSYRAVNTYSDLQIGSGSLIQVGLTAISSSVSCSVFAMQGNF